MMGIWMILLLLLLFALCYIYYRFPLHTVKKHDTYDACIVLGSPAQKDGTLSRIQRTRMDRAIGFYHEKMCSCIIISGGSVVNHYEEADIMARYAQSLGIPASALLLEKRAKNTYENLRNAKALCEQHHIHRVIVVTSNFHVRRSAFFAKKFFTDFMMAGTLEKEKLRHYVSEYFRMWNTLYFEISLRRKSRHSD